MRLRLELNIVVKLNSAEKLNMSVTFNVAVKLTVAEAAKNKMARTLTMAVKCCSFRPVNLAVQLNLATQHGSEAQHGWETLQGREAQLQPPWQRCSEAHVAVQCSSTLP